MRQHRWIEFLKDFNLVIIYHSRKVNVVADDDALSQKLMHTLAIMFAHLIVAEDEILADLVRKPTLILY